MTPSWNPRRHVFDRQVLTHWHKWSCGFMRRSARRLARRLLYFLSTESNQGGARRTRKAANPSRRKMDLAARLSPRLLRQNPDEKLERQGLPHANTPFPQPFKLHSPCHPLPPSGWYLFAPMSEPERQARECAAPRLALGLGHAH